MLGYTAMPALLYSDVCIATGCHYFAGMFPHRRLVSESEARGTRSETQGLVCEGNYHENSLFADAASPGLGGVL
jgi:hypothetical protein